MTNSYQRYFLSEHEDKIDFIWLGDGKKLKRAWHYESCTINKVTISIGDTVLVKQYGDEDEENSNQNIAIGLILELFESVGEDPNRAKILWYFKHAELPRVYKAQTKSTHKQEVFTVLDESSVFGSSEEIDAETICSRCNVIDVYDEEIPKNLKEADFFTRYGIGQGQGVCPLVDPDAKPDAKSKTKEKEEEKKRERKELEKESKTPRTPKSTKKIKGKGSKSEPPKTKKIDRRPLEALSSNATASPKRRGSDSVYKEGDAPPDKMKKKQPPNRHQNFTAQQVIDNLWNEEEDDGNLSDISLQSSSSTRSNASSLSSKSSKRGSKKSTTKVLKKENQEEENKNLSAIIETRIEEAESKTKIGSRRKSCMPKISAGKTDSKRDSTPFNKPPAVQRIRRSAKKDTLPKPKLKETIEKREKDIYDLPSDDEEDFIKQPPPGRLSRSTKKDSSQKSGQSSITKKKTSDLRGVDDGKDRKRVLDIQKDYVTRSGRKSRVVDPTLRQHKSQLGDADEDGKDYVKESGEESADDDASSDGVDESSGSEKDSGSDDEECFVKKTPARRKRKRICMPTPSRSKKQSTSTKKPTRKPTSKPMTPGIGGREIPRSKAISPLEFARQRLHVSAVPETLPCREEEYDTIYSFVQDCLQEGAGGCMYISGVPGTGKTATVHEIIRSLRDFADQNIIPQFKFIEVNGMRLTDPNQTFCKILKDLTGQKATPDHAASILEKRFSQPSPKKENTIILVDELDLLWTKKQNVMYNLFDWPTRRYSRLTVLAIANTMDLPERIMMNRVSSRLGLTRLTFQPYAFRQLQEIVLSRIRGMDAFEEDALELVARKVAALSGDARRCLDICRRAVEIAEEEEHQKTTSDKNVKSKTPRRKSIRSPTKGNKDTLPKQLVGMKHVEVALKEMFLSPKILALQSLSMMEEMFMKAVISEFRRSGLEEAQFTDVYEQLQDHCRVEGGFEPPNTSEAFTICNNLGSFRLLLTESGSKDILQRIRLNVSIDDILFAFKAKELS